ncbi:MAG: catechol 2,3-dioxygenase [Solirubrobacteraceae bacterium]|nr:catechol 2,3-dioxygenase [Solirubrobacteraceae bacterium]
MAIPVEPGPAPLLPDTLRLGPVHLTVSTLDGSIAFYQRSLGLQLHDRDADVATLGAGGEDLLVLVEETGAAPGGRHAGLYHYALLFETRRELARAVRRLAGTRTRIEATSDHGVCESIYLRDPDDNGIELYADRPREQWPAPRTEGDRVEIFTVGLDMDDLMSEIDGEKPRAHAGQGLVVGHLHLHIGDVEQGLAFYRDVLGFAVMANLVGAALVAAGGYHHHLGFNVWLGRDVKPRPPQTAGLREWTVLLASRDELAAVRARIAAAGLQVDAHRGGFLVRDPWGTAIAFRQG